MKKLLPIPLLCLSFFISLNAQVTGDSCTNAPFLCGEVLDTYSFYTDNTSPVVSGNLENIIPYPIDNNYWLSWTPCETTVDFQIMPIGCANSKGIEAAVLQTPNCDNFSLIDYTTVSPGSSNWVINNLNPGEVYYLMFDGIDGDDCFVTIEVNSGVSVNPTQFVEITPGSIDGPEKLCPDEIGTYTLIQPVIDIIPGDNCPFPDTIGNGGPPTGSFVWSIPDKAEFVGDSTSNPVQIVFPMDSLLPDLINLLPINDTTIVLASGQVYPTWSSGNPSNDIQCNASGSITPIPPKDVEVCVRIENEQQEICQGNTIFWNGQAITQSGYYFHYENCVLKILDAIVYPVIFQDWGTIELCQGECYVSPLTGIPYCDPGFQSNFIYNAPNCIEEFVNIVINVAQPISSTFTTQCSPDGATYTATIEIIASSAFFTINGVPNTENPFTTPDIPNGEIRTYDIFDYNVCNNTHRVTVQVSTPQVTENWGTINLCPGECYDSPLTGQSYCDEGAFAYSLGCVEESGTIVFESADPITASATTICSPDGQTYTAIINLSGGEIPYFINGNQVNANSYQIDNIPNTEIRNLTVSDNSACTADQSLTVELNTTVISQDWGEIKLCPGECFESNLTGERYCNAGAFASANGCLEESGIIIFDNSDPITANPSTLCSPDGQSYDATITFSGGDAPYFVDGIQITDNAYTISDIPNGETRSFLVADNSSCNNDESINIQENCGIFGAPMGDSCTTAPFICGESLNGWNFTLDGLTNVSNAELDNAVPFLIENNAWLGWTPCEPTVEFVFDIENCTNSSGVEIAILQTSDCQLFTLIESGTFAPGNPNWIIENLTPGEVYYFMFDGVNADICGIQINVISGISTDPGSFVEITPGFIDGPEKLCPDELGTYTLIPAVVDVTGGDNCPFPDTLGVDGGGDLCWHIPDDADFVGDSTGYSIDIVFPLADLLAALFDSLPTNDTTLVLTSGLVYPEYKLDTTFNDNVFCGIGGSLTPIAPKEVSVCISILHDNRTICEGDSFDWNGQTISDSGVYTHYENCTLEVLTVQVIPQSFQDWGVIELCPGACFESPMTGWTVCNEGFFSTSLGPCGSEQVNIVFTDVLPLMPTWSYDCEPDGQTYTVTIDISGGQPPYFIDGSEVFGNYSISGLLSGTPFSVQLSDSSPCNNDETISDQHTCPVICPYEEGRMSNTLLETCDPLVAKTEHLGGEQYPTEGTFEYILHTKPSSIIGDIIARNKTGEFNFDENQMDFEMTYYVSFVVGLEVGGQIDLNDQCTKATVGQPIVFHKSPSISSISATPITCRDSVSTLNCVSDATEFLWSNSNGFAANQQTTLAFSPGTFSILVKSEFGCEMTSSIDVIKIAPQIEDAIFKMTDPICFGDENGIIEMVEIIGSANEVSIKFNNEDMPFGVTQFENLGPGTYYFEVFDENGCSIQKEYSLHNPLEVKVDLGNDFSVIRGTPISLEPVFNINPTIINWDVPTDELLLNAPIYSTTPIYSGNYLIEIMDENDCAAIDQIYVTVEDKVTNIFVPSAFSPNNDGKNDLFEFYSNDVIEKVNSVMIFNRWGVMVYEKKDFSPTDKSMQWDGTFKGQPLNSDVFSYVLKLQLKDGTTAIEKGDLTLLR